LCSGSRVAEICNTVAKLLGPNKDGGRGRYSLHCRKDERHAINNYAKSELHEYAGIYVHGLSFISDGTFSNIHLPTYLEGLFGGCPGEFFLFGDTRLAARRELVSQYNESLLFR
jgi:hypothetical protein